jgi:predicted amidohydrolase YtcJ
VLGNPRATRTTLDSIAAEHPVMLQSWTEHGVIVNTAALRTLGVRDDEPDPQGGRFARTSDGHTLAGLAEEAADRLLFQRLARPPDTAARVRAFQEFARMAASFGITSVQAMTPYPPDAVRTLLAEAQLPVRVRLIDFPVAAISTWHRPGSRRQAWLTYDPGGFAQEIAIWHDSTGKLNSRRRVRG